MRYEIYIFRVKDNNFVFCAMKVVIPAVLKNARELGITVKQIVHKVSSKNVKKAFKLKYKL